MISRTKHNVALPDEKGDCLFFGQNLGHITLTEGGVNGEVNRSCFTTVKRQYFKPMCFFQ